MTLDHWLDTAKLVGILFCAVGVAYTMVKMRRTVTILQADTIRTLQADVDGVAKEVHAIDSALSDWRRGFMEEIERIWKQVRFLAAEETRDKAQKYDFAGMLQEVRAELAEIKTMVRGLPCTSNGAVRCPRCNEAYQIGRNHTCPGGTEPT